MSDAVPSEAPRRRWVKPVLIVSLALNLLFIGLIAGAFWKGKHGKWRPRHVVLQVTIEQMMQELPAERRAAGTKALALLSGQFPAGWKEIKGLREDAIAALTADPYDEERFSDLLAKIRQSHDKQRKVRHDAVIEFVRDMTPAERKRFVEVYRSNKRGPWKHGKDKDQ